MGERGAQLIEVKYNWQTVAADMAAIYQGLTV